MRQCYAVEIQTPKGVLLNGLWFGPKKAKRVVIFIHGLTASAFSMSRLREALVDTNTAVMTFNNRGFEQIASVKRKKGATVEWINVGAGREVFTESADDVQGAVNFAKRTGVTDVYLAGHSSGAQKAVYWASRTKTTGPVRGIVLLGPLSDYAGTERKFRTAVAYAKKLMRSGKPHELMPDRFGHWFPIEAQRFLSLYTPDSAEELFPYSQVGRVPRVLRSIRTPILALFAGSDEHQDRPAEDIAAWFIEHIYTGETVVIPGVEHSFRGGEESVARSMRKFMKEC